MTTSTTLPATILGTGDVAPGYVDIQQLPNGDLFVLQYQQNSSAPASKIEFLNPGATSISDVTAAAVSGALPSGLGSTNLINQMYVGTNALPDIVLGDGGWDQPPWTGSQIRILVPDSEGRYVDETSALPQVIAYTHRLSTGTLDGQAAIVAAQIGNESNLPTGVELVIANPDGSFTDWTSHIPASVQNAKIYTYDVIGDFTGSAGDIFLGSENATVNPSVLLVNDGKGNFTAENIAAPAPQLFKAGELDFNGFPAQMTVVYALPTQFAGDTHEDLIAVYANSAAKSYGGLDTTEQAYYLQFLKGDDSGGFTDVTSQHLASQPVLADSNGFNAWVVKIQQVDINGFNDLVLYEASGGVAVLINNGQDGYTVSPAGLPSNLTAASWGTDNGVQGFYGFTTSSQWVFIPVSQASITQSGSVIDAPLASQIYLYGANGTGAKTLGQTFETPVTITLHGSYNPTNTAAGTFHVLVNGQDVGNATLVQTYGFTYQGGQYTTEQTFTFEVSGLASLSSLQVTTAGQSSGLYLTDAKVGTVDLGSNIDNWVSGQNAINLDPGNWNAAYDANIGSASDPIRVTGGGGNSMAHVLGSHAQYTETGLGTSIIHLNESAGLNQNAVLTDVSYIVFQDGAVLNTQTGDWASSTITTSASLADTAPVYVSTINVTDSAAAISGNIDALQSLAAAGTLGKVSLSDGGIATLTISAVQLAADSAALKAISGAFNIGVTAPSTSASIVGGVSGLGTIVDFADAASKYTITANSDHSLTVTEGAAVYHVSNVTELHFADTSDIVASQVAGSGGISSAQVTNLYAAVFGRLPDVGGLAYYEQMAAANPSIPITTYAQNFLSSPEYVNNGAHNYGQNSVGDAQFITDTYTNLLHRNPGTGDVAWYQANVIAPFLGSAVSGTAAYTQAELAAHAALIADFSQSAEFLGDVQITANNPSSSSHWLLLV